MTQEKKVRAYDEAIKKAKEIKEKIVYSHLSTESCKAVSEYIDTIIPELKESEDERIRKAIIGLIEELQRSDKNFAGVKLTDMLAYLEKQKDIESKYAGMVVVSQEEWDTAIADAFKHGMDEGEKQKEQKPTVSREEILHQLFQNGSITLSDYLYLTKKWSEEDEIRKESCMLYLANTRDGIEFSQHIGDNARESGKKEIQKDIDWLKSLHPKPTEKINEEDKYHIERIISYLGTLQRINAPHNKPIIDEIEWLKAFRPNFYPHLGWKPSKEQMDALDSAINYLTEHTYTPGNSLLISLFTDLQKLP